MRGLTLLTPRTLHLLQDFRQNWSKVVTFNIQGPFILHSRLIIRLWAGKIHKRSPHTRDESKVVKMKESNYKFKLFFCLGVSKRQLPSIKETFKKVYFIIWYF